MEKIDARKLSADGRAMLRKMVIRLRKLAAMPEHVMRYFRHPSAADAAQGI